MCLRLYYVSGHNKENREPPHWGHSTFQPKQFLSLSDLRGYLPEHILFYALATILLYDDLLYSTVWLTLTVPYLNSKIPCNMSYEGIMVDRRNIAFDSKFESVPGNTLSTKQILTYLNITERLSNSAGCGSWMREAPLKRSRGD